MSFQLKGIGTAIPRESITQDDAVRMAIELAGTGSQPGAAVGALYRRSGVQKRHSAVITSSTNGRPATQSFFPVATSPRDRGPSTADRMRFYEEHIGELAERATRQALDASACDAGDIAHLVTVSCTGFNAPGLDVRLLETVGLRADVTRTHIGFMGCHGALNGLRVASALSQASPSGNVLLCCAELCCIHHQYDATAQQAVANSLFADGAAAVVGSWYDDEQRPWRVVEHFSSVLPGTDHLMAWRIGDHGFEMQLSTKVPAAIKTTLRPWLTAQLARHSLRIDDIRSWAIHPGGPRILAACAESLELESADLQPSQQVLREFGNMSSPTVLFILEQLQAESGHLPCVALAFGPGLTIEAALIA